MTAARAETFGPLLLYVGEGPWRFYGRPAPGATGATAADVAAVRARQRELRVAEALEWVEETSPWLAAAAEAAGMTVQRLPLMGLRSPQDAAPPEGVTVRVLEAGDAALAAARAVADVGFAAPGTAVGEAGAADRDRAAPTLPRAELAFADRRVRQGLSVIVVAEDEDGPVAVGGHNPVGGVTELTGIATLPTARRRGIGAAVTAKLAADARARGVELVFLTAGSEEIARVYERAGFERVGTGCTAAPAIA